MSGTDIFIDTNICIYLLNGDVKLAALLQDQNIHISFITEIELLAYFSKDDISINTIKTYIDSVNIIDINNDIKQATVAVRKAYKLKLPDSIIAGSALTKDLPFISADKGFKKITALDLVLYELT